MMIHTVALPAGASSWWL